MEPDRPEIEGISRRRMLKRIGAGAAIAWSAPVLTSFRAPAFAVSPVCQGCGGVCGTPPCPPPLDICICLSDENGVFHCGGNFFCAGATTCATSADCVTAKGPGWFCQADGCFGSCGSGVCVPPCGTCPTVGTGRAATGRTNAAPGQTNR